MHTGTGATVAILLATHNSSRYIEQQLTSLVDNATPFTLHWLDDQSTDDTRVKVQHLCGRLRIDLKPAEESRRCGVPAAFFKLVSSVEADAYLFCDQDDIWQPGKVDHTVAELSGAGGATLSFSEPWVFQDETPRELHRYFEFAQIPYSNNPAHAFWNNPAVGNTVGFTRPLRETFMATAELAMRCAIGFNTA